MTNKAPIGCILSTIALLAACGGEDAVAPDGDAGPMPMADGSMPEVDGGSPAADGGSPGMDAGSPAPLESELWGARLYGRIRGLARFDRELWINTSTATEPLDESKVHAQVARLDLDSGEVTVWEDELPEHTVGEGPFATTGPVATAQTIRDGERAIVVARSGLLTIEDGTVTEHELTVSGAPASPIAAEIDREGGRAALWVTTNLGLLRLDADTLAVEEVIGADVLSTEQTGALAVDPATGDVYVAAYFEAIDGSLGSAVMKIVDGALDGAFSPGELGNPDGLIGDIVWSANAGGVYVALGSWDPTSGGVVRWDGTTVEHVVDESVLSRAARGEEGPFGATELAIDETDQLLIVGGIMRATGPFSSPEGGGLAWIDLASLETELAVAGVSTNTSDIPGDHVMALAYDPATNRTYASLQHPCSETKLGNVGLMAVRFSDGKPSFEMPILSGVRDVAQRGEETWTAISDDVAGIRCEGTISQQGMVKLADNRSGLFTELRGTGDGDDSAFRSTRMGFSELDFFEDAQLLAMGDRNPLFAGPPTDGLLVNGAVEFDVSLWLHDVLWEDARVFWVGGQATHHASDPDTLANVGPRGAARVVLSADGRSIESYTHYVHALRDPDPNAVEGLPSSEVTDILRDAAGNTWLVSGTERVRGGSYPRLQGEPFEHMGSVRTGGVSRIAPDGTLEVIAEGDQVPDGRAAAFDAEGVLHVLDAERGLLALEDGAFVPVVLPPEVPAGSVPQALWMGPAGDLAAAYSTGLLVHAGGQTEWLDGFGWAWSITSPAQGVLLVGTDQGLLRVRFAGAEDPAALPLPLGGFPRFRVYDAPGSGDGGGGGGGGACLPEHTVCGPATDPCCPGLTCSGFGFVTECVPE